MNPITLPLPPGINKLYKISTRGGYGRMYKSAEGVAWSEEAYYLLKSKWKRKVTKGSVALYITVHYSGRFDIDSCLKPLLDVMQGIIYENDHQVDFLQVTKVKEKKGREKVEVETVITE